MTACSGGCFRWRGDRISLVLVRAYQAGLNAEESGVESDPRLSPDGWTIPLHSEPRLPGRSHNLVGLAIFYESWLVLVGAFLFWVVLNYIVIMREERGLEARHKEAYRQYLRSAPRWF